MIPKFRAWDTYEEEMLENVTPLFDDSNSMMAIITDFQIKGSPGTSEIEIGSYDTTFNWDEFPYVIMQSTGLKDKNGVEIFEGDVVKVTDGESEEDSYISIVKNYSNEGYPAFDIEYPPTYHYDSNVLSAIMCNVFETIEVIGNVYEDGDLLNDSEDTKRN